MMNCTQRISETQNGKYDGILMKLYGKEALDEQRERYISAIQRYSEFYDDEDICLFSAPGRTELCGNHTDHNGGLVIAGSLSLDILAVGSKSDSITVISEGYRSIKLSIADTEPVKSENGNPQALIKGILHYFRENGYNIGGFKLYMTSDVLKGSGMSSSAAFEILICTVLNHFYNNAQITPLQMSVISQKTENVYFGKPCGLMDQLACSYGGIICMDFSSIVPHIVRLSEKVLSDNCDICVLDTGASHASLTEEYASVPDDMRQVAGVYGKSRLIDVDRKDIMNDMPQLMHTVSHRAIMRAVHFYSENDRVRDMLISLENGDINGVYKSVNGSGSSSFEYLQNVYVADDIYHRELALALMLAREFIGDGGACRVHGGGFAGTTLNLVSKERSYDFCKYMNRIFGNNRCRVLRIREYGGVCIE
ncbi:MAG: galactokinase [Acutalibacteraceae bacterium]